MKTQIGSTRLELMQGDITDQDVDAVVNAAHWDLLGGQGVDGAVHWKGGPDILAECRVIGSCPIGGAVMTSGGKMKARHVIHTVGPIYEDGGDYEAELLAWAYKSSLRLAVENHLKTIAFPSLSTGAFSYPMQEAAPIALRAVIEFLQDEPHDLELVRFVLYAPENVQALTIYEAALQNLMAATGFHANFLPSTSG